MMRLRPCVRYGVHIDADVRVREVGGARVNGSAWVHRAILLLKADAHAFAVRGCSEVRGDAGYRNGRSGSPLRPPGRGLGSTRAGLPSA